MNYISRKSALLIVFLLPVLIFGCGESLIYSKWIDREITIDGVDTEWTGARYLIDKIRITVGVLNDGSDVYIRMSSTDAKTQALIMKWGLMVWFDSGVGENNNYGLRFPLGNEEFDIVKFRRGSDDNDGAAKTIDEMIKNMQGLFEIFGPGKEEFTALTAAEANDIGIEAGFGMSDEILVYELKLPLTQNDGDFLNITDSESNSITMKFETGKFAVEKTLDDYQPDKSSDLEKQIGRNRGMLSKTDRRKKIPDVDERGRVISHDFDTFEFGIKINLAPAP